MAILTIHRRLDVDILCALDLFCAGSRIHVFKFHTTKTGLQLLSDTFEQLKPGLSSFADDPEKAVESLKPLIEIALKTVPKDSQVGQGLCSGSYIWGQGWVHRRETCSNRLIDYGVKGRAVGHASSRDAETAKGHTERKSERKNPVIEKEPSDRERIQCLLLVEIQFTP